MAHCLCKIGQPPLLRPTWTMIRLAMMVWRACSKIPYRGFSAFVAADGANSPILSATETASANV